MLYRRLLSLAVVVALLGVGAAEAKPSKKPLLKVTTVKAIFQSQLQGCTAGDSKNETIVTAPG